MVPVTPGTIYHTNMCQPMLAPCVVPIWAYVLPLSVPFRQTGMTGSGDSRNRTNRGVALSGRMRLCMIVCCCSPGTIDMRHFRVFLSVILCTVGCAFFVG